MTGLDPRIREIVRQSLSTTIPFVFVCGMDVAKGESMRAKFVDAARDLGGLFSIDPVVPDAYFEQLLSGTGAMDLLEIESYLARDVAATVVFPESPGSIAELGAFASSPDLSSRLIVVPDPKYPPKKGFIELGPIRHLERKKRGKVLRVEGAPNFEEIAKRVARVVHSKSWRTSRPQGHESLDEMILLFVAILFVNGKLSERALYERFKALYPGPRSLLRVRYTFSKGIVLERGFITGGPTALHLSRIGFDWALDRVGPGLDVLRLTLLRTNQLRVR